MRILLITALVTLSGCASSQMIAFTVSSQPPGAQVDVNGVTMGMTPTEINLQCSKQWVGLANAPGGWRYDSSIYEITVYPSAENPGLSQTKRINACQARDLEHAGIMFDLDLEAIGPRQTLDVNVNINDQSDSVRELEATLRQLADLHDRGILTDEEYAAKRAEVIRQFAPN